MRLRAKVLLLATVPLMLAILGVVWVVMVQSDLLARAQIAAIEPVLVQARKDELKHFVQVGGRALCRAAGKRVTGGGRRLCQ